VTSRESDVARDTYRHLRMMLIALPVLLLVAAALSALVLGTVEGSLSAYYLGPIRDVLVGTMVGTAVCLVAYRGAPLEDYALNLAGFYAVFVAFVPTGLGATLAGLAPEARAELVGSLRVTIVAVLVVAAVFVYAEWRTGRFSPTALSRPPTTRWLFRVNTVLAVGFLGLVGWRLVEGDAFGGVHLSAAVLLIVGLVTAVASHGWPEMVGEQGAGPRGRYRAIALLMVAGLPLLLALRALDVPYAVILTECWEIALFAAFWIMETVRTWRPRVEGQTS
jgi:hypothetical protein